MASKTYGSAQAALDGGVVEGMTLMSGGFDLAGNPENLISALKETGGRNLTLISNNCGAGGFGLWKLLANVQIRKMISSYVGENKLFEQLYLTGDLELELNPQGTAPSGSAPAAPAFYTKRRRRRGGRGQAP